MTTPSINTPTGVIQDAYEDAGLLSEGAALNPDQLAKGMRRLRDLINFMQTKGLKLWVNTDTTVPIVAGTAAYTFAPAGSVDMTKPLRSLEAYYLYTATNTRRPLSQISLRDYWTLGQAGTLTSNRGTMTQYLVEKLATQLKVTFWLCPDANEAANGEVHLLLQTQITNPTNLTETMNFPEEWRIALRWGLADDLATGQPETIMNRCKQNAEMYRTALEDWDVEDAPTSFAPNIQQAYPTGGFR